MVSHTVVLIVILSVVLLVAGIVGVVIMSRRSACQPGYLRVDDVVEDGEEERDISKSEQQ